MFGRQVTKFSQTPSASVRVRDKVSWSSGYRNWIFIKCRIYRRTLLKKRSQTWLTALRKTSATHKAIKWFIGFTSLSCTWDDLYISQYSVWAVCVCVWCGGGGQRL